MNHEEHLRIAREQHPEESYEQIVARVKYREKHMRRRKLHTWATRTLPKLVLCLVVLLILTLWAIAAKAQTPNVNIDRVGGTKVVGTVPISGTVSTTLSGTMDTNVKQYNGVAVGTTNGFHVQPGTGAVFTVTWPSALPVSSTQLPAALDGSGFFKVSVQNATLAVTQSTSPWVVSCTTANCSIGVVSTITNVVHVDDNAASLTVDAPVGTPLFARLSDGSAALIGQKAMAASIPVVVASDQAKFPVNISQTATDNDVDITSIVCGTGSTNLCKAEDAAHVNGDTGVPMLGVRNDGGSTLSTDANGDHSEIAVDGYNALYARADHPNRVRCTITSTATTSTAVTGCSAPGASLSIYITTLDWSSSIISTTANFMRVQSGTGGTCGSATTVLYDGYASIAFGGRTVNFNPPIKATANHEICFVHASAGTRLVNITGFIAP